VRSSLGSWLRSLPWWERASLIGIALWMLIAIPIACVVLALGSASGCAPTVLVPEGSPVRIGPGTRARIYVMTDGEWRLSPNHSEIPNGWYVVPPSYVED
jgi:hypothetical protein